MLSTSLTKLKFESHTEDLRRAAARCRVARASTDRSHRPPERLELAITIRPARPADASALTKLADYDSAEVPSIPVLIAEANGELHTAVSLDDGAAIAHPLHHTKWMVQLLHVRARQLWREPPPRWRRLLLTGARRQGWAK